VDNQRTLLLVIAAFLVMMIWFRWEDAQRAAHPEAPESATTTTPSATGDAPAVPKAPVNAKPGASGTAPAVGAPEQAALERGKRVHVKTDLLDVEIDTLGGDVRYLGLRKLPRTLEDTSEPFPLMHDEGKTIYIAQSGLVGHGKNYPFHRTRFVADSSSYTLKDGEDKLVVDLHYRAPNGVRYTKRFSFSRNSYVVRTEFLVDNRSNKPWEGFLYGQFLRHPPESKSGFMALPTFSGGAIYTKEDHYQKIKFSKMEEENLKRDVTGGWAAMMQHYFVGSWMPAAEQKGQIYTSNPASDRYVIGYKYTTPLVIAPGKTGSVGIDMFAGPKEHKRLKKLAEGMELTVDFGWLTFIASPLFWLLTAIHGLIGNWGWSIIVLTIMIKAVFFPLNNAQYKSMAKMKKVGPRMKAMKEQYGDDRERYSKEMMELYKREKINPMSGCLPIFIQIPVFIALYWVLLESVEMRQAPFMLWIQDLSSQDPYYVLPILMGASMFVTTWMSPTTDPMQRKMFLALPLVFTVFFLFFPAGLVLYWFVNNVLQIIQQTLINRSMERSK
jgi:YidC/Oxa1 family membrane protein insertase